VEEKNKMANINNPFKIIGSYIGLAAGILFTWYVTPSNIIQNNCDPSKTICPMIMVSTSFPFLAYIIYPTIGFLLGWGIQEIYRRFK